MHGERPAELPARGFPPSTGFAPGEPRAILPPAIGRALQRAVPKGRSGSHEGDVRSVMTLERLRSNAIRVIFGCAAIVLALVPCPPTGASSTVTKWVEVAGASFDGVKDGPGDGKSFGANVGALQVRVPSGRNLSDIAPSTGISSGRLVLSDAGTIGLHEFGVSLVPAEAAASGALISFDFSSKCEGNKFSVDVTNGATSDCSAGDVTNGATSDSCCPGDVTDGATTDLVTMDVDGGTIVVNGHAFKLRMIKSHVFRVDLGVYDVDGEADGFEIAITDLDTGAVETWSDDLAGDYLPVTAVNFVKRAGHPGELSFDNLSLFAPAK